MFTLSYEKYSEVCVSVWSMHALSYENTLRYALASVYVATYASRGSTLRYASASGVCVLSAMRSTLRYAFVSGVCVLSAMRTVKEL
jgi:hypothetical protein